MSNTVSELCSLRWDMLDLAQGRFHVTRRKNGRPSVRLIRGTEIRDLRRLKREQVPESIYVFTSERRGPMTPATFRKLLTLLGQSAGLPFPVHPHMLRHACGYKFGSFRRSGGGQTRQQAVGEPERECHDGQGQLSC